MKHNKFFTLTVALILSLTNTTHSKYSNPELDGVRAHIRKTFIAKPTPEIIKLIQDEKPLESKFQQYLEEDPMMQKIEEIEESGTSGTSLSVISFSQDVKEDFAQKGEALTKDFTNAILNTKASQIVVFLGVVCFGVGVANKNGGIPAAAAGTVMMAGGGYGWYIYDNQVKTLPKHIKTIHVMEEKWNQKVIIRATRTTHKKD